MIKVPQKVLDEFKRNAHKASGRYYEVLLDYVYRLDKAEDTLWRRKFGSRRWYLANP